MKQITNEQKQITNEQIIEHLVAIKKSIIAGAPDVLWMENQISETVCERIDAVIIEMSECVDGIERPKLRDELQSHYDANASFMAPYQKQSDDVVAAARAAGTHDAMANALGLPTKRELVEQMVADAGVHDADRLANIVLETAGVTPPSVRLLNPLLVPMRQTTPMNTRRAYMRELCDQFTAHVMDSFNDMADNFDDAGAYMTAALEVFIQMKNDEHDGDGDHEQFEDVGRNGWKIDGRGDE